MLDKKKWQQKWDRSTAYESHYKPSTKEQINAWKALDLLSDYAAFSVFGPFVISFFRSLGFGHKHSVAVENAISGYYQESFQDKHDSRQHTVECVLKKVRAYVGSDINPTDPLHVILTIIKENTGVDYEALDITSGLEFN